MAEGSPTPEHLDAMFHRLAGGDRTALAPSFQILLPLVHRYCEHLLRNAADADDATQLTLERVFEQISSYDPTRRALPWVLSLATWEVKTLRRRAWRNQQRKSPEIADELVGATPDPETAAISRQILSAIEELTETLPIGVRDTLKRVIEREVISEILTASDATFRKRKERVLDKVRSLLRNLGHVQ